MPVMPREEAVKHHELVEEQLFEPPTTTVHIHASWTHLTGWQVHVAHRHEGQHPTHACAAEFYDHLTWAEASDVMTIEVCELLPWLGSTPEW